MLQPRSRIRPLLTALLLLAAMAGGIAWWKQNRNAPPAEKYKTQTVERGNVMQTISANGTLNPVTMVNIGTQISGTVKKLHVDFNSLVKPGQVLAELDPALFEAQHRQDQANLAAARANLELARAKEQRARLQFQKGFISADAIDQAKQQLDAALAQIAVSEAQLERGRTNLRYTVIRSPISGVVVARSVDVGQTVAASFQTPTLFQIAGDLKDMQIETSIAEADIGSIRIGQAVNFSVDAFAERQFAGKVKQIRLNPTVQQNVVTYNVVVAVSNTDGLLLPGMTGHVQISTGRRDNVLRVPNAALRFKPKKDNGEEAPVKKGEKRSGATVYRLEHGEPQAVKVKTGLSDGTFTEILDGEVREGDQLVTRELGQKKKEGNFGLRLF
jgi:HlyD family secretion protein